MAIEPIEEMRRVEGQTFTDQPVELDGVAFVRCHFVGCELVFNGESAFSMDSVTFGNGCTVQFAGRAQLTLNTLDVMFKTGGPLKGWVAETIRRMGITQLH